MEAFKARVHSFPPLADRRATTLILGTMPGQASLSAGEYYAFDRNAFWNIIEVHFGVARAAPYAQRCAALCAHGIALWDVLHSCSRDSSADSDIVPDSIVANDIGGFLREHPAVTRIYFNGARAEALFTTHVRSGLGVEFSKVQYQRLPSTSPANARVDLAGKIRVWSVINNCLDDLRTSRQSAPTAARPD